MSGRTKIMQHCFGVAQNGGPIVAFERLIRRSVLSYGKILQTKPAGGISLGLIFRFMLEIRKYRPDLIHVRGLGNEGFHAVLAAKLAGVPNILVSIHGTHRDLVHSGNRLRSGVVKNILEPMTLIMATHIATVCDFTARRSFLLPYRHKLIGIVPNGVDLAVQSHTSRAEMRGRWGIPCDWFLGICVSRITTEKGYPVLAEALSRLDKHVRNLAVLVVGGGDERGRIEILFRSLQNIRVIFVGHQADVQGFLTASDFFIFPSLHENLSNALIEAMAQGLPVIASAVGGNIEVVQKGGGILVPVGDAAALADAINKFLSDSDTMKQMGVEARENIRCHYSIDEMVAGWERVYSRILVRCYEQT